MSVVSKYYIFIYTQPRGYALCKQTLEHSFWTHSETTVYTQLGHNRFNLIFGGFGRAGESVGEDRSKYICVSSDGR